MKWLGVSWTELQDMPAEVVEVAVEIMLEEQERNEPA